MNEEIDYNFRKAVEKLEILGIHDKDIYLVDIIPLVEMMWADGVAQDPEIEILQHFLDGHIEKLNQTVGYEFITKIEAYAFAQRFLKTRPDPHLLETLRNLVATVSPFTANKSKMVDIEESILAACLNIASSAVTEYPYELTERFNLAERKCYFEITGALANIKR